MPYRGALQSDEITVSHQNGAEASRVRLASSPADHRCARAARVANMHAFFRMESTMPERPSDPLATITRSLSDALAAVLPAGADWQRRVAPIIEATLERLELVPREDFERQRAQLERLAVEVTRLEARIAALEGAAPH